MASITWIQKVIPDGDGDVNEELQVLTVTAKELRDHVQARGFYKAKFSVKGGPVGKGGKPSKGPDEAARARATFRAPAPSSQHMRLYSRPRRHRLPRQAQPRPETAGGAPRSVSPTPSTHMAHTRRR